MSPDLKKIVALSAEALKIEDTFLLEAKAKQGSLYERDQGGVLAIRNERYYQFIVARYLMEKMTSRIGLEVDRHDIVVYPDASGEYDIAVEMKRWMSHGGVTEIRGIKRDIEEKLARSRASRRLMLLFSANAPGETTDNLKFLANQLERRDVSLWETSEFQTSDERGMPVEFWLAGFQVDSAPPSVGS